jgi:hypothetical protein
LPIHPNHRHHCRRHRYRYLACVSNNPFSDPSSVVDRVFVLWRRFCWTML